LRNPRRCSESPKNLNRLGCFATPQVTEDVLL
jgi:hypothetical protein